MNSHYKTFTNNMIYSWLSRAWYQPRGTNFNYRWLSITSFQAPVENTQCHICGASISKVNIMRRIGRTSCKKVKCLICNLEIPFLERESHKALHVPIRIDQPTSPQTNIVPQITQPEFQNDENYPHIYTAFKGYIEPSIKTWRHRTTYFFDFSADSIAN